MKTIQLTKKHFDYIQLEGGLVPSAFQYSEGRNCPIYRAFKEQHPGTIEYVSGYGSVVLIGQSIVDSIDPEGGSDYSKPIYNYYIFDTIGKEFLNGRTEPFVLNYPTL